jgi:2-oxoglutarate ferredoxin oxidoreductase subunit alpha
MGNVAAAEGALAAGCRFYAGYPITPSSEIMERMAARLPEVGGVFIQMEDEIASISAIVGASWTGLKAMTATSGPGLSLMMEGLGYAAWTETPVVILDVQRAGPATGQATRVASGDIMQVRYGSHGDYHPIALSPWSVQEMYDLTIRAFNLAERYRVPAFVLTDEGVSHLRETALLDPDPETTYRKKGPGQPPFGCDDPAGVPPMPCYGEGERILVTGSTHDEWGWRRVEQPEVHARLVDRINRKITDARDDIVEVEEHFLDDAEVAVVAYGFTARSAMHAVRALHARGVRAGLLRLKTLWPFPVRQVVDLAGSVKRILVPEMNRGQVAGLVRRHALCDVETIMQTDGQVIEAGTIERRLEELL